MKLKYQFLNTIKEMRELGGITDEMLVEKLLEQIKEEAVGRCFIKHEESELYSKDYKQGYNQALEDIKNTL